MTRKARAPGCDSRGPHSSLADQDGRRISMLPREADVVNLDAWRARRARLELPAGPDRCPPWCEWCYGGNRLDWRGGPS